MASSNYNISPLSRKSSKSISRAADKENASVAEPAKSTRRKVSDYQHRKPVVMKPLFQPIDNQFKNKTNISANNDVMFSFFDEQPIDENPF